MDSSKDRCKECLKVYLGLPPYLDHQSRNSSTFLMYVTERYGLDLVEECREEIRHEQRLPESDNEV